MTRKQNANLDAIQEGMERLRSLGMGNSDLSSEMVRNWALDDKLVMVVVRRPDRYVAYGVFNQNFDAQAAFEIVERFSP